MRLTEERLCRNCLEQSFYRQSFFAVTLAREPWSEVGKALDKIVQPICRDLLADIFWLIFSDTAVVLPRQKIDLQARLNYLIVDALIKSRPFQQLSRHYRGNIDKAMWLAINILVAVLNSLPTAVVETARQLDNTTAALRKVAGRRVIAHLILAEAGAGNGSRSQWLQWQKRICECDKEYRKLEKEQRGLLAHLMRLWYTGGGSSLAQTVDKSSLDGGQAIEMRSDLIRAEKMLTPVSLARCLERAQRYVSHPKTREIANRALVYLNQDLFRRHVPESKDTLEGIGGGAILELILPEQWLHFFRPEYKKYFYTKIVEEQLWQHKFSSNPPRLGELVICVDCSGSMQGPKEIDAKALCLCFMEWARQVGRDCTVIFFSGEGSIIRKFYPEGKFTQEDIMETVELTFVSKTTSFIRALQEVLRISMRSQEAVELLFISDGLGEVDPDLFKKISLQESCGKLLTWAIILEGGLRGAETIGGFAKRVIPGQHLKI